MARFRATLYRSGRFVFVPERASRALGPRRYVPVAGTIEGFAFRTTLFSRGDGAHMLLVNRKMQDGAGVGTGEAARFAVSVDTSPRTVAVPADLRRALARNAAARREFELIARSHKQRYVDWIGEARRPETRARRIERALEMLLAGERL